MLTIEMLLEYGFIKSKRVDKFASEKKYYKYVKDIGYITINIYNPYYSMNVRDKFIFKGRYGGLKIELKTEEDLKRLYFGLTNSILNKTSSEHGKL